MESSVTAILGYLSPKASRPYNYLYPPPDGGPWSNNERRERVVAIADLRCLVSPPQLQREGFALFEVPLAACDFGDPGELERRYYPQIAGFACAATGAEGPLSETPDVSSGSTRKVHDLYWSVRSTSAMRTVAGFDNGGRHSAPL